MIEFDEYYVSESDILDRTQNNLGNYIPDNELVDILRFSLGIIDLTTLEGSDTEKKIEDLCIKAKSIEDKGKGLPNVAAVCVYPPFVKIAKNRLDGTGIFVASVAAGFPAGQTPLFIKKEEVKFAVDEGADEIDIVISRGKVLQGDLNEVFDEIASLREVSKNVHLKVILETGELETIYNIRKASELAINAGADFIKTSTGKIKPAATVRAVMIMLDTIKEYYNKTDKMIGIKPAGGISEKSQVIEYYGLVQNILGQEWLNKNYFRFGASRLVDNLVREILSAK